MVRQEGIPNAALDEAVTCVGTTEADKSGPMTNGEPTALVKASKAATLQANPSKAKAGSPTHLQTNGHLDQVKASKAATFQANPSKAKAGSRIHTQTNVNNEPTNNGVVHKTETVGECSSHGLGCGCIDFSGHT